MKSVGNLIIAMLAVSGPSALTAPAHAQEAPSKWRAQVDWAQSPVADQDDWVQSGLELRYQDQKRSLDYIARFEQFQRYNTIDENYSVGLLKKAHDNSYFRIEAAISPDAVFRPQYGLDTEIGWIDRAPLNLQGDIVWSVSGVLRHYDNSALKSVVLGAEYYPESADYWFSGKISQTWIDETVLNPGLQARIDIPVHKRARLFGIMARGYEPVGNLIDQIDGSAFGMIVAAGPKIELTIAIGSENRSIGRRRTETSMSISRAF